MNYDKDGNPTFTKRTWKLLEKNKFVLKRALPCPFCGNTVIQLLPQKHGMMMIRCSICTANKLCVSSYVAQWLATWNHRT
jgi:transcription elongation factor Elf1